MVEDAVRSLVYRRKEDGTIKRTAEGLYGRRKMTAASCRRIPVATSGAADRAMRTLGLAGVRRGKAARTPIPGKDGKRAGGLLNRDFTAAAPNRVWVADFTYVRIWAGFVYVAFIVDVYAQRIIGWHADTSKATELVYLPLRMGLWQRGHEGHPVERGQLVAHSDAASTPAFASPSTCSWRESSPRSAPSVMPMTTR